MRFLIKETCQIMNEQAGVALASLGEEMSRMSPQVQLCKHEKKLFKGEKHPTDLFYCLGVFIVILLKCISYKRKYNILLIRAPIQM